MELFNAGVKHWANDRITWAKADFMKSYKYTPSLKVCKMAKNRGIYYLNSTAELMTVYFFFFNLYSTGVVKLYTLFKLTASTMGTFP
jgi:hypothetical protein